MINPIFFCHKKMFDFDHAVKKRETVLLTGLGLLMGLQMIYIKKKTKENKTNKTIQNKNKNTEISSFVFLIKKLSTQFMQIDPTTAADSN